MRAGVWVPRVRKQCARAKRNPSAGRPRPDAAQRKEKQQNGLVHNEMCVGPLHQDLTSSFISFWASLVLCLCRGEHIHNWCVLAADSSGGGWNLQNASASLMSCSLKMLLLPFSNDKHNLESDMCSEWVSEWWCKNQWKKTLLKHFMPI